MPKPIFGDNGSGMHCHQSIWKADKNLFAGDRYAGLSETALNYIGGILKHAPAICAFTNPGTNSYKRLVPGFEAPVNLAYPSRNRSASVRIPFGGDSPKAKRLEFRCPDPTANPYLAFAAMMMAGLDGIQNKTSAGDPLDKDIYALSPEEAKDVPQAPGSLDESLKALDNDHAFLLKGDVFTPEVISTWVAYKRENELDAVRLRPHPYEFALYVDTEGRAAWPGSRRPPRHAARAVPQCRPRPEGGPRRWQIEAKVVLPGARALTGGSGGNRIVPSRTSASLAMGSLPFSARAVRTAWRIVPKRALSGAIGWSAGIGIPERLRSECLVRFARLYGIDTAQAEKSLAEYSDVDDFFTRRLRPGVRPIDPAPDVVVSPADGTVIESGLVTEGHLIQAKGVLFELDELLASPEAAQRLNGGAYLITYLSPSDYHRVHSPVEGAVVGWHHIPGTLFPVGAKSVGREPGLFISNERLVTLVEGPCGLCAVVMVAAVGVGHITAAYDASIATHTKAFRRAKVRHARYDHPLPLAKGDEVGTFHLGSTTIVVFEPGRVNLSAFSPGDRTNMGETIGRLATRPAAGIAESR